MLYSLPQPAPMSTEEYRKVLKSAEVLQREQSEGAMLLDLRSPEAYAGAYIPGSFAIPLEMIPVYTGYLLDYESDIILVPETPAQILAAVEYLIRIGYVRIEREVNRVYIYYTL